MKNYHVVWEIDVSAESPRDAAAQALAIQRDPSSIATVFDVFTPTQQAHVDVTYDTCVILGRQRK